MKFENRIKKLEAKPIPLAFLKETLDISEEEAERVYHEVMDGPIDGTDEVYVSPECGWVPWSELSEEQAEKVYRDFAEGRISMEEINNDHK
ncbi:hypothetical protein [Desulfotignum balticum]|uniref:hypothetical protein n=1 Tax=Desulfotignum balticum TaxID=115781 RepID=UPI0004282218|nr:hypothetical protein [Desulfotignum balticum]